MIKAVTTDKTEEGAEETGWSFQQSVRGSLTGKVFLFSRVQLFATLWTAAHQASLSFTILQNLLKFIFTDLAVPFNHLTLCCPLLLPTVFPSIRVFSNESAIASGGKSIGASASTSVLLMNIQGWFSLGLTGLISLQPKGLSRLFTTTTVRNHQFLGARSFQLSHPHRTTGKTTAWTIWTFVSKVMSLLSNMLSLS